MERFCSSGSPGWACLLEMLLLPAKAQYWMCATLFVAGGLEPVLQALHVAIIANLADAGMVLYCHEGLHLLSYKCESSRLDVRVSAC